jgi:class 3 adenylate cyclase
MPRCSDCGQANPEIARFCLACGAPLVAETHARREMRKRVTIVFADVTGSSELAERLDPEALRRVMGRYFDEMRRVVERHGGTVEKFIGDAVMAVFGIPVLHEDDALRAVVAANEMREALGSLNAQLERELGVTIKCHIGVNSGEVVAGDAARGQAFATGDAVNVANRLQELARPGEILIGEPTYRLARDAVTVAPVDSRLRRGKGEKARAFRLLAVAAARRSALRSGDSPFVGRRHELEVIAGAFSSVVQDSTCRLLTVLGAAGVGKSRLVDEFLASGVSDEAMVVRGRCLPYGEGITFWPIKEAITEAAALSAGESPEAARERIRSLVEPGPGADLIVERVTEVLGLAEAVIEHRAHFWAIASFLESLARRRPLVAVFDDIQWAEPTFLDLVEHVVAEAGDTPILLLCVARPELLELRTSWEPTIRLEPLSDDETERLIESLLGGAALPEAARAHIAEVAEGSPLFVEEMVTMLIDEGLLRRHHGSWVVAGHLAGVAVPPSIQALLATRVERLGAMERVVLERGSVEGKVFHRGAILQMSPEADRSAVEESLTALVREDLLKPDSTSFADEGAFRFRHQLLRDAAYELLPKETRSHLHERFASWLEEKVGKRASEYEEILGYHLEQAYRYRVELGLAAESNGRLGEEAAKRLGSAGLRARARGDLPAAANLLSRAIGLVRPDSATSLELAPKLRDALFESGELTSGRLSWTSLRCFWRWRFGHRWLMADRLGRVVLRCKDCGKAKDLPRGWSEVGFDEHASLGSYLEMGGGDR